jgi:hypothetical protein
MLLPAMFARSFEKTNVQDAHYSRSDQPRVGVAGT